MHRKPQLQEAARKLQEIFNNRDGEISHVQALEIIGQLEGFEGYQQLRDFVSRHSQRGNARHDANRPSLKAPTATASTATGPLQTLAMTLCGHGGFTDGYKRIDLGRPDVQFVHTMPGDTREISFMGRTALMHLADNEAGFPHEVAPDPAEIVARVKGQPIDENDGQTVWLMGFDITVADMRAATKSEAGWWKVGSRTLQFWETKPLRAPVATRTDLPKPEEMTREQYIALSDELERHELDHAMGQDTDNTYQRMAQLNALLSASPWCRDMDTGDVVLSSESIYGTKPA